MPRAAYMPVLAFALLACDADAGVGGDGGAGGDGGSVDQKLEVQIGTYDGDTLDFSRLPKGGDIPLRTFGQGGTHAALAVRCIGFGNTAFIDVDLENIDSTSMDLGTVVSSVKTIRPQLLLCRDAAHRVCDDLPFNVMTGGLADPAEKDGLPIRVGAKVHNERGAAQASEEAVLRKDF